MQSPSQTLAAQTTHSSLRVFAREREITEGATALYCGQPARREARRSGDSRSSLLLFASRTVRRIQLSRHPHIAHLQRMNHVALLRHPHAGPSVSSQPSVHLLFLRLPHQLVLCQPSPLPVITAVSGCTDVGSVTYNCTSGATLAIHGTDFVDDDNAALVFPYTSGHTVCWINPQLYATNITCNLFTDDRTFLHGDKLEAVQIGFPSIPVEGSIYYYSRPLFYGVAFLHVPLPSITSISGCDDSNNTDGQYTVNCVPEIATITLAGVDFSIFDQAVSGLPYNWTRLSIGGRSSAAGRWEFIGSSVI